MHDGRPTAAPRIALRRDLGDVALPLCRRSVLLHGGGTGRPAAGVTAAWHRRQLPALALPVGWPLRSLPADRVECPLLSVERQSAGRNTELPRLRRCAR